MIISNKKWTSLIFASVLLLLASSVDAEQFIVKDIEINGLERVSPGTVLNYVPARVGKSFDTNDTGQLVRALYKTGLFDDVGVSRRDNILVISITERPAIAEINISGNNDFETDQLLEVLRQAEVAKGRSYNRSVLERLHRELREQYFARGKYTVEIETTVENLPRNRVAVNIDISEGKVARIKGVNIVGNRVFEEAVLLKPLESGVPGTFSLFSSRDEYSKQKLAGDVDKLTAFYRDQGYLNFDILSTQVSLTPDKRGVYITLNIKEGDQYTVRDVTLAGNINIAEAELRELIEIQTGQIFSQKDLERSRKALEGRFGEDGYAFVKVQTAPDVDEVTKTVSLTFLIDPGQRTYVRRIAFKGNYRTRDEVFRREMRQLESAWYSRAKVERSKVRIQRLPFIADVKVETIPVAGTNDQVDLEVTLTERLSGTFSIGAGYAQSQGFLLNVSMQYNNFLGTGKSLGVTFDNSQANTNYSITYNNPYYTIDGVSRGFDLYYRETNAGEDLVTDYLTDRYGGRVHYTFPLSETNSFRIGVRAEHRQITATEDTVDEVRDFITRNGNEYNQFSVEGSYVHDTRNRTIFPTKGQRHSIGADVSVPGSDLEFYKVRYDGSAYFPVTDDFTFALKGRVYYGDNLPFFEKFYGGGIRSVRGFEHNSLGPLDSSGDPFGGDLVMATTAEVLFPAPFIADVKSFRLSAFVDAGNVFADVDAVDANDFRYSVGLGATWLSPVGPFTLSYAKPINSKAEDREQLFQFSVGTTF